jgi:hypothetical protein
MIALTLWLMLSTALAYRAHVPRVPEPRLTEQRR